MFGDVSCSNCSVSELVFRQDAFLMITIFNVKKLKQLLAKGEDMIVQYFSSNISCSLHVLIHTLSSIPNFSCD